MRNNKQFRGWKKLLTLLCAAAVIGTMVPGTFFSAYGSEAEESAYLEEPEDSSLLKEDEAEGAEQTQEIEGKSDPDKVNVKTDSLSAGDTEKTNQESEEKESEGKDSDNDATATRRISQDKTSSNAEKNLEEELDEAKMSSPVLVGENSMTVGEKINIRLENASSFDKNKYTIKWFVNGEKSAEDITSFAFTTSEAGDYTIKIEITDNETDDTKAASHSVTVKKKEFIVTLDYGRTTDGKTIKVVGQGNIGGDSVEAPADCKVEDGDFFSTTAIVEDKTYRVNLGDSSKDYYYHFEGWYTKDGIRYDGSEGQEIKENVTLHAEWTDYTLELSFNFNESNNDIKLKEHVHRVYDILPWNEHYILFADCLDNGILVYEFQEGGKIVGISNINGLDEDDIECIRKIKHPEYGDCLVTASHKNCIKIFNKKILGKNQIIKKRWNYLGKIFQYAEKFR